jgi:hypothetical protein
VSGCSLDSSGSRLGLGSCEYGAEVSGATKYREFLDQAERLSTSRGVSSSELEGMLIANWEDRSGK